MFSRTFQKWALLKTLGPYQIFAQSGRCFHLCHKHMSHLYYVKPSCFQLLTGLNNKLSFVYRQRNFSSLEDYQETDDDTDEDIGHYKPRKLNGSSRLFEFKEQVDSKSITKMTSEDWNKLEKELLEDNANLKISWEACCMSLINSSKLVELGISLADYLKSQGRSLNIATISVFMMLLSCRASPEDQKTILQLYQQLLDSTGGLLDCQTIKYVINGLCCTDSWKDCFQLLSTLELTQPTLPKHYTPIILAAIRCADIDSCILLLHKVGSKGLSPTEKVYLSFLDLCQSNSKFSVDDLFHLMHKYRWLPNKDVLLAIIKYLKRDGNRERWSEAWIKLDKRGICPNCNTAIDKLDIPFSQFQKLRRVFFEKVLIGKDLYQNTNPAELESFKLFVEEKAPFDVVFDSLNVSLKMGQMRNKSFQLRKAVEYFALIKKMKVLVVGRKYMLKWPERDIKIIKKLASCFFIENISEDDPYLIYATLYSGPRSVFVSSDEMRDHKFSLGEEYGELFRRWQYSHQVQLYKVKQNGHIIFQWPRKEDIRAQRCNHGWHIPFENEEPRPTWQDPSSWLCLQKKSTSYSRRSKTLKF
ncbi:mitochondrial ribonuclease P catalytic subunit [Octopus sinensis]|uniref:Mitochondrial ribonuclease P catalytic subunit n=1 Tax=Octopus sinensis TaxID=2607531 RepID=A0A6P7SX30_9MOLL|nr:mitochondrial ribonuclease P catalytic subunit [Octopus sinensis]XP_036363569.1 mitochondrial ribonuclease P catalytic subunit [Octopus sinensis]